VGDHGTRRRYQAGCSCTACRAAEAEYRASLRRLRARGKLPLGGRVDARPMLRQIRALRIEGFTDRELAARLGVRSLRFLHREWVRLRTALMAQRLYRLAILDEALSDARRRAPRDYGSSSHEHADRLPASSERLSP
jgi:hypothetical protein